MALIQRLPDRQEWFQLSFLAFMVLASGVLLYKALDRYSYPYFGFAMGIAGICIAIQQMYLFVKVDRVLEIRRRELYQAGSLALISIGSSILLFALSNIVEHYHNPQNPDGIVIMYKISLILKSLSNFYLVRLVFSFLYSEELTAEMNRKQVSGKFVQAIFVPFRALPLQSERVSLSLEGRFRKFIIINWRLLQILTFCLIFVVVFPGFWPESDLSEASPVSNPMGLLYWGVPATVFQPLCSFVSFIMLISISIVRLPEIIKARTKPLPGTHMFLSFMVLGLYPLGLQMFLVLFLETIGLFSYLLCGLIALVAFWSHCYVFSGSFVKIPEDKNGKIRPTFSLVVVSSLCILLTVIMVCASREHPHTLKLPWEMVSFAFLTLACAAMTAIDLERATKASQDLEHAMPGDNFYRSISHEIINPLYSPLSFLKSPRMARLLEQEEGYRGSDQEKEDRHEMLDRYASAINGAERVIDFATGITKRKEVYSSALEEKDLFKIVKTIVEIYKPAKEQKLDWEIKFGIAPKLRKQSKAQAIVSPSKLDSVLRILLDNSLEASVPGRENNILVELDENDEKTHYLIRVVDLGGGLSGQAQSRFGLPQASKKGIDRGVGIYTAIKIVENMQGALKLEHTGKTGSCILVSLPKTGS